MTGQRKKPKSNFSRDGRIGTASRKWPALWCVIVRFTQQQFPDRGTLSGSRWGQRRCGERWAGGRQIVGGGEAAADGIPSVVGSQRDLSAGRHIRMPLGAVCLRLGEEVAAMITAGQFKKGTVITLRGHTGLSRITTFGRQPSVAQCSRPGYAT